MEEEELTGDVADVAIPEDEDELLADDVPLVPEDDA
jgi:hypothetical protein